MNTSSEFASALISLVGPENVFPDEPLCNHTTFRIGGPAQWLATPRTEDEVAALVALCRAENVPWRVLGAGSNVLAPDAGLPGLTLKLAENFAAVEVRRADDAENGGGAEAAGSADAPDDADGENASRLSLGKADALGAAADGASSPGESPAFGTVFAQAGATNAAVAEAARAAGLAGYEFASGIPGTIGGAAIMNAGAYGGQFSDVATEVRCLTSDGDIRTIPAAEAAWGYRTSRMMHEGWVVLGATLRLRPDAPAAIAERMDDLRQRREDKQPLEMPSAGSTFKRPQGHFAGKLIQDAGCQGLSVGGAQVSKKHAGFVVNTGGATAADVLQLIREVQRRVEAASGVRLEPEVRLWE